MVPYVPHESLREIGEEIGCTAMNAYLIEQKALRKIREGCKKLGITEEDFVEVISNVSWPSEKREKIIKAMYAVTEF